MSLLTTRLGIKKPQDPDPFLTADFQNNYDLIDSYPGTFVCTSGTKPTWGTAQTGQLIFCTDTRTLLEWIGTAWLDPLTVAPAFEISTNISSYISPGAWGGTTPPPASSVTYTVGTFNSSRAGTALLRHEVTFTSTAPTDACELVSTIKVNGVASSGSGRYSQIAQSGNWVTWYPVEQWQGFGQAPVVKGTNTVTITITHAGVYVGTWGPASYSNGQPIFAEVARCQGILANTTNI